MMFLGDVVAGQFKNGPRREKQLFSGALFPHGGAQARMRGAYVS